MLLAGGYTGWAVTGAGMLACQVSEGWGSPEAGFTDSQRACSLRREGQRGGSGVTPRSGRAKGFVGSAVLLAGGLLLYNGTNGLCNMQ